MDNDSVAVSDERVEALRARLRAALDKHLAIWWTSEQDCEDIGEPHYYKGEEEFWDAIPPERKEGIYWLDQSPLPEYIGHELASRSGRNGRGRLWVPEWIHVTDIPWPEDNLLAKSAERCGGIVFHRDDLAIVKRFPGFVTDFEFNLL